MSRYATIRVGDRAELRHTITPQDLAHFVELTGDDNKLHLDPEYAASTVFKKPVAHGMLGASFISTVIGTKLPGDGALWFAQNLEFLLPVRVGDTITVQAEVLKKHDRDSIIELQTDIYNQHKQKVTTGVAKVKIIEPLEPVVPIAVTPSPKVALVVGATGGIGSAVARRLQGDGFAVAVHYFANRDQADQLVAELNGAGGAPAIVCRADIADLQQVEEMVQRVVRGVGTITVLVNCATGKLPVIGFPSLAWEDVQAQLDLGVKGTFNLMKAVVPVFETQKQGKIINFTTQAIETPSAGWLHYITAKSALHGLSRAMAVELASKGITVNLVSPGMTDTELIADIPEKVQLMTVAKTPLRRLASPADIAGVVSFLASPGADYLTGETIRVNGGQVML